MPYGKRLSSSHNVFAKERLSLFTLNKISILCASENLSDPDSYFAGPNHSALGELCENQVFYEIIFDTIQKMKLSANAKVNVSVPNGALSKAIGQKKKNKLRLTSELSLSEITFTEDQTLKGYDVRCEERKA